MVRAAKIAACALVKRAPSPPASSSDEARGPVAIGPVPRITSERLPQAHRQFDREDTDPPLLAHRPARDEVVSTTLASAQPDNRDRAENALVMPRQPGRNGPDCRLHEIAGRVSRVTVEQRREVERVVEQLARSLLRPLGQRRSEEHTSE